MEKLWKFLKDEEGIEMVEWGLMAALFAMGLIVALGALTGGLGDYFKAIGTYFGGAPVPT